MKRFMPSLFWRRRLPRLPQAIGPYQLRDMLIEKRDIRVFVGEKADGRRVVLKIANDKEPYLEAVAVLLEEGALLLSLEHPNIRRCYEVLASPYTQVLEYIDGSTVLQWLDAKAQGKIHVGELQGKKILGDVARALAYLHGRHVVHCDVTPRNIMISSEGRVVLIDLDRGIWPNRKSKVVHAVIPHLQEYTPPELLEGRPLTFASDIFQLGVVGKQLMGEERWGVALLIERMCSHDPDDRPHAPQVVEGLQ